MPLSSQIPIKSKCNGFLLSNVLKLIIGLFKMFINVLDNCENRVTLSHVQFYEQYTRHACYVSTVLIIRKKKYKGIFLNQKLDLDLLFNVIPD